MTKYEWERQLKKGISGLPKAEQQRVLDYYNELFADKIDAGLREQYIISEFGNPYDVANKILVDYYNGDKENPDVDAYIYADSDDIDVAFEEETVTVVEAPKRKKVERVDADVKTDKEDKIVNVKTVTVSDINIDDDKTEEKSQKKSKGAKSASGLIVLICVLLYCILGACFNLWHPAWLIFLIIPCVISLIEAINRRNWRVFAYPLFATSVFLALGFFAHNWHPAWIVFITIPLYYVLGDFITKNVDGNKTSKTSKPDNDGEQARQSERVEKRDGKKRYKSDGAANVISVIAKVLMTICFVWVSIVVWSFVIGLFCSGIGMIVGGIGYIAGAFVGATTNLMLVGAGLAVLGLGLICAFGMVALFKPCANMCKSFIKTIKKSFDKEDAI